MESRGKTPDPAREGKAPPAKILIVEDEAITADDLRQILAAGGYDVVDAVSTGEDAVGAAARMEPDLVLMDIILEGAMDGVEAAAVINSRQRTPVIYVTANPNETSLARALAANSYGCINKPFTQEVILGAVGRALEYIRAGIRNPVPPARRALDTECAGSTDLIPNVGEEIFSNIFHANPLAMSIVTIAEGRFVYVNQRFLEDSGYSREKIIGRTLYEINFGIDPGDLEKLERMFYADRKIKKTEAVMHFTGAREATWMFSSEPVMINGEECVLVVMEDITEKKLSEERLRLAHKRLADIINFLPDPTFVIDRRKNIIAWNRAIEAMTGLCEKDVLGNPYYSVAKVFYGAPGPMLLDCIERDISECGGEYTSVARQGDTVTAEVYTPMLYNGRGAYLYVSAAPLFDDDGTVTGAIESLRDISEHRRMEAELYKSREAAETANRAKSEFLANMSHELRTPLNSILGYAQLLEMEKVGPMNERQARYLRNIRESGSHLLEMVNDILDLAKIESGKTPVEKKPFDISLMLSRSPTTIRALAQAKGLEMLVDIPPGLGFLNGDEVRIKQIVYNLLSNAVKFTDEGRRIGISAATAGDTVEISVWDEGIGISPEDIEKIFDPFEQARNPARNAQGTGLGLSITRRLVELHDGRIRVASSPGNGSRFTVVLPGRADHAGRTELPAPEPAAAGPVGAPFKEKKTVLIVEDNPLNMELLREALDPDNYTVICAPGGAEALAAASSHSIDLVLMDNQLPGFSGDELLKRMKELIGHTVPVLAVTAYAMKGDREKFLGMGFDEYIPKPIDIKHLQEKVDGLAGRE